MGIALFTVANLLVPVRAAFHACTAGARSIGRMGAAGTPRPGTCSDFLAGVGPSRPLLMTAAPHRPLRVVRVVEGGRGVGRMVISGRMADVCAELDRLAAHEV